MLVLSDAIYYYSYGHLRQMQSMLYADSSSTNYILCEKQRKV